MRINLNFKDSNIRRLSKNEFEIAFDLSNMIKPRLSENVRMYIEHFNICEFLDEALGLQEGDLKGFFELRCNNIEENSYDTEYGNNGDTLIFTSPLENYRTFVNNNPMYINNFKISQNFLQNRLVMNLKIFDRYGQPYDSSKHLISEIDKNAQSYKDYIAEMNKLNDLNNELESTNKRYDFYTENISLAKGNLDYYKNQFQNNKTKLLAELQQFVDNTGNELRMRIIIEQLIIFLKVETFNSYKNYFDDNFTLSKIDKTKPPFRANPLLTDEFYESYINYVEADYIYDKYVSIENQLETSTDNVITQFQSSFTPFESVLINKKTVPYEVFDTSATPATVTKSGDISISYFNSVKPKKEQVVINNLTETIGDLTTGDLLIIDKANFESSLAPQFTYYFAKTGNDIPKGILLSNATNAPIQRFSLRVIRNADTNSYLYVFLDNEPNILKQESSGFVAGDTITIQGEKLGGVTGTNDLVIEVLAIDALLPDEDFPFNNFSFDSGRDLGTIDFVITKPNDSGFTSGKNYVLKSSTLTNSKNYVAGETVDIKGNQLNGVDSTNDLTLTATEVWADITHSISNSGDVKHSIIPTTINHDTNNVVIEDSGGTELTGNARPSEFEIIVTSSNGQYSVEIPTSKGFSTNSKVLIKGSVLTGVDGTNDLQFTITTVDGQGKIDDNAITFPTTPAPVPLARTPEKNDGSRGFDISVKQILKKDEYDYVFEPTGKGFVVGDIVTIEGDVIGGSKTTNDLKIKIDQVDTDGKIEKTTDLFNTAVIIDHDYGEIKVLDIAGLGRFIPQKGQITNDDKHSSSATPVAIPTNNANLEITLTSQLYRSKLSINTEYQAQDILANQKKDLVVNTTRQLTSTIGKYQEGKLKCMNMSLVLYDEVPEYTQASQDAIKGNTYSRNTNCQFKRI
jgi:hypothetical protein